MHGQPKHDLVYISASGALALCDEDDARILLARCYSGYGAYRDNPDAEGKGGLGPIPRGVWKVGPPVQHPRFGPVSFHLTPVDVPNLQGRSAFLIHGDNKLGNFSASRGCIIAPRRARDTIAALGCTTLLVQ